MQYKSRLYRFDYLQYQQQSAKIAYARSKPELMALASDYRLPALVRNFKLDKVTVAEAQNALVMALCCITPSIDLDQSYDKACTWLSSSKHYVDIARLLKSLNAARKGDEILGKGGPIIGYLTEEETALLNSRLVPVVKGLCEPPRIPQVIQHVVRILLDLPSDSQSTLHSVASLIEIAAEQNEGIALVSTRHFDIRHKPLVSHHFVSSSR